MLKITKVEIYKTNQNLVVNEKFIISVEIKSNGLTHQELSYINHSEMSNFTHNQLEYGKDK